MTRMLCCLPLLLVTTACLGHRPGTFSYQPPPVTKVEDLVFERQEGQVYIEGRWMRHRGDWAWQPGRFEPARAGYVYMQGFWEKREDGWHWEEGQWLPERDGYVWRRGFWTVQRGDVIWTQGGWVATRYGYIWIRGGWSQQSDRYMWVAGRWVETPAAPVPASPAAPGP